MAVCAIPPTAPLPPQGPIRARVRALAVDAAVVGVHARPSSPMFAVEGFLNALTNSDSSDGRVIVHLEPGACTRARNTARAPVALTPVGSRPSLGRHRRCRPARCELVVALPVAESGSRVRTHRPRGPRRHPRWRHHEAGSASSAAASVRCCDNGLLIFRRPPRARPRLPLLASTPPRAT